MHNEKKQNPPSQGCLAPEPRSLHTTLPCSVPSPGIALGLAALDSSFHGLVKDSANHKRSLNIKRIKIELFGLGWANRAHILSGLPLAPFLAPWMVSGAHLGPSSAGTPAQPCSLTFFPSLDSQLFCFATSCFSFTSYLSRIPSSFQDRRSQAYDPYPPSSSEGPFCQSSLFSDLSSGSMNRKKVTNTFNFPRSIKKQIKRQLTSALKVPETDRQISSFSLGCFSFKPCCRMLAVTWKYTWKFLCINWR